MQVVASINKKLQELVVEAQQVAASGDSGAAETLLTLRTGISKLAAVQQEDVVASIGSLAAKFAADPTYHASIDIADFSDVSIAGCVCLRTLPGPGMLWVLHVLM